MAIKRGVSLYSYQQTQFFKQMTWKDMLREVRENLHADGIEIISESTIPHYPFPSDQFIFDWNNEMARYDLKAVTMDVYLDVHQFRNHVMNHKEAAERLKYDIQIAARMGFENVRCLCMVPIDVIEMALPTAEKYNVRIGKEIHPPLPIVKRSDFKVDDGVKMDYDMAEQIMKLADRTGSKHVGLVPDFGIFMHTPSRVSIEYEKRHSDPEAIDFILQNYQMPREDLVKLLHEKYPNVNISPFTLTGLTAREATARPEDLLEILPYIVSIHGKFYEMTEIEGQPGHYEDKSIDYENPIKFLKQGGYDGYINSEYEGQRHQQDMGFENLPNEVEEVRRHHEMLQRLFDQ
ncbi:putative uncharacterized protein [Clostridium sp. CAG:1013]|nr:putative uncharacterized protein [Clostridium sp. CAG:1013]